MASIKERIGRLLNTLESRLSLWNLLGGGSLMASFGLPAWAVEAAGLFQQYSPLSWVVAGFAGVAVWVALYVAWQWGFYWRVRARFNAAMLERGSVLNPMKQLFTDERIFINDLVLPSYPIIHGKTFVNCDLIGPGCIYFYVNTTAQPIRYPRIDAVWVAPKAKPTSMANAFFFDQCTFTNCSFQRITLLVDISRQDWKDNPHLNWISIPPSPEHLQAIRAAPKENPAKPLE